MTTVPDSVLISVSSKLCTEGQAEWRAAIKAPLHCVLLFIWPWKLLNRRKGPNYNFISCAFIVQSQLRTGSRSGCISHVQCTMQTGYRDVSTVLAGLQDWLIRIKLSYHTSFCLEMLNTDLYWSANCNFKQAASRLQCYLQLVESPLKAASSLFKPQSQLWVFFFFFSNRSWRVLLKSLRKLLQSLPKAI